MSKKNEFIKHLTTTYPSLNEEQLDSLVSDNLLSPFRIKIQKDTLGKIAQFIKAVFSMRQSSDYLSFYSNDLEKLKIKDPKNKSVMMSYDFHIDENGIPKLIEINTNASFLILGTELYESLNEEVPVSSFKKDAIKNMFLKELSYIGIEKENPSITIIDENPETQRLYLEFLVAQQLLTSFGFTVDIKDIEQIKATELPDLIYNRHTDFFLTDEKSQVLRKAYLEGTTCLSPNPFEYYLLADKQRMIDWHSEGFFNSLKVSQEDQEIILSMTPKALDLTSENSDLIWSERKKYFFKPKNSFGSKQSYRGSSISSKVFKTLIDKNFIVQEFIPAPELELSNSQIAPEKFKYDLRCYAYEGTFQVAIARIYQGQVTNLRTQNGGFATVEIV